MRRVHLLTREARDVAATPRFQATLTALCSMKGANVDEMAHRLALTRQALTFHFHRLSTVGLARYVEREGQWVPTTLGERLSVPGRWANVRAATRAHHDERARRGEAARPAAAACQEVPA